MSRLRTAMTWLVRLLPWLAFAIAAVYLLRLDPGAAAAELGWPWLALATALVLAVYPVRALAWWRALAACGVRTTPTVALASEFRNVLMKFLPGKIWVMLGRASEVSLASGAGLGRCTSVSVGLQLLTVASGLLLGAAGVAGLGLFGLDRGWALVALALLAGLAALSLSPRRLLRLAPGGWRRRLTGKVPLDAARFPDVLALTVAGWLLLGAGYAAFFEGLGRGVGQAPVLLQPLANAAGIAAVFAPGGLGVREGATAGYLIELGLPGGAAIALGVWARFWIVAVELLVFLLGVAAAAGLRRRGGATTAGEASVASEQAAG